MPTARSKQIDLDVTPYYHCHVRCVRKAYLCGIGENQKDYNHRRGWIETRLQNLIKAFAIDIASYAIMNNHYHVVLHVDRQQALSWKKDEVIQRWALVTKINPKATYPAKEIKKWRANLYSISWFMRFLNESIAIDANQEDKVTGRFWEGRFKSKALTDDGALLACMTYNDLNPIRGGIANTLESSEYTSIQKRLEAFREKRSTPQFLMDFQSEEVPETPVSEPIMGKSIDSTLTPVKKIIKSTLPFALTDYITLVDWTGRQVREGKGRISANAPSIVKETGLNPEQWLHTVTHYGSESQGIAGALDKIKAWAVKCKQKFIRNQNLSKIRYLCPS